jgi:Carboxypeptidase regulatory-like domain/TonB dependent receptor
MTFRRAGLGPCLALLLSPPLFAQSQAANGTIEGVVRDSTGAVLPGVTVTVVNLDTGASRSPLTDGEGIYRAPLLPLGTYRVKAELTGFKAVERTGVSLSAGQAAVINITLEVGGVAEVVSVSGESPVAQPGKVDLGRTISEAEVKNLPLVSRNPYNFALLQPNVTGFENDEFGVPRINANGTQMRTNYQLDGNTNTQKDRAGLRLLPTSEIVVREVSVVTSGFAPEFGQTTGMVYNAVTPSGSNRLSGAASFRFRRKDFSSRPFFLPEAAKKPDTYVNNWTGTLGGPIVRDKWHFYAGAEYIDRDLSADRVITVSRATADRLGLSPAAVPESGVMPTRQHTTFLIGKTDYQLSPESKLSARYLYFNNDTSFNVAGGLNTLERATDQPDRMHSMSVQLISSLGASRLNELRFQFSQRSQSREASLGAGEGPAVTVSGVANFGAPVSGTAADDAGFVFKQRIWQVLDNFTLIHGRHSLKAGVDVQRVADDRQNSLFQLYTFATVDAYLAARDGTNPRAYSTFTQRLGDPDVSYGSTFYGFFVQDEFRVSPALKLVYGLRYDLFDVPSARPFADNPLSQDFKIDKNNLAPRIGISWSLDAEARTVLRASSGIMYQPPFLNFYEDGIQSNGDPRSFSVSLNSTSAGAPAFPGSLANTPPGFALPRQSITGVDPDFSTEYAIVSNVQVERALGSDFSVSLGYVNSLGRNLPELVDTNIVPTGLALPDGRPVYAAQVSAATRVNPLFDHVNVIQSTGRGTYHALTVALARRMSHGVQLQASYTLADAQDNAPLAAYVVGSGDDRLSDPSSLERDRGKTPFYQKHTFVLSSVLRYRHNQLGLIVQANSGLPFNIRANRDLNQDGLQNDRPNGIARNQGRLGRVLNVDARYSRFVPLGPRVRAELFAEAKNAFNTENVAAVNRVVPVNTLGELLGTLPAEFPDPTGYQQRRIQLGAKVTF